MTQPPARRGSTARESLRSQPSKALQTPPAVLDEAHLGDIEGALGRIRAGDEQHSWRLAPQPDHVPGDRRARA